MPSTFVSVRMCLIWEIYNNLQNGIHSTTKYLEMFFSNLLLGTDHELKNRYMHIDYVAEDNSQSVTPEIPKCQNDILECSLEELAVLNLIKANPSVKQQELADTTRKSLRSIKRMMEYLQDQHYIRRENGKRYGKWEILI